VVRSVKRLSSGAKCAESSQFAGSYWFMGLSIFLVLAWLDLYQRKGVPRPYALNMQVERPSSISSRLLPSVPEGSGAGRRRRNRLQVVVLLAAMVSLLAYCGWFVGGSTGIVWAIVAGVLMLSAVRRLQVAPLLRAMDARPLRSGEIEELDIAVATLCARAGLSSVPYIYRIEEALPLAFSMSDAETAVIVVSDGLLAGFTLEELCGILAHEIAHLRHGDLLLLQIGLVLRLLTRLLARLGLFIVLLGLVLNVLSVAQFNLLSLAILVTAPVAMSLLALTLSREREAEADLEAANLTGDPLSLASALIKLRRWQAWQLRQMFPTGRIFYLPTLLRDHPPTEKRIRRLREMVQS